MPVVESIRESRFYLSQEDCNVLNNLVPKLEERMRREDEATVWIVRSTFKPHPAMSPNLYYIAYYIAERENLTIARIRATV